MTYRLFQRVLAGALALATCIAIGGAAEAAYKIGDDTKYLKVGGLLQARFDFAENADGDWRSDIYVRRMRLMFYGQVTDKVNFFVETDNANFGKGGNLEVDTFIQDAYLELNLSEYFQMDIGMLLSPFSHHGMQGATSLLGMDYHGALVKYPGNSTKVWRDFGLMLRGMISKWFEWRVAVFKGVRASDTGMEEVAIDEDAGTFYTQNVDPRNHKTLPRIVGRLTFNVFEPEGGAGVGGMFYDGLYIKKTDEGIVSTKKVLSIGGSIDWQGDTNIVFDDAPTADQDVRGIAEKNSFLAANADVFWDIPLGEAKIMSLNGQVNFYYYNYGDRSDPNAWYNVTGDAKSYTGLGIMGELGFRYDAFQPLFLMDWYNSEGAWDADAGANDEDLGDVLGLYGGFNYWMLGHSTNFKVQFGGQKANGGDFGLSAKIQAQLIF
jgi:hypothetical protein